MKNIRVFLSENFQFLELKFSIYLNRRVFVMSINPLTCETRIDKPCHQTCEMHRVRPK